MGCSIVFTNRFMTILKEYKDRHEAVKKQLLAIKVEGSINCERIGYNLEVSGQTVRNYLNGSIKDGYLAESILKAAKQIKK